MLVTLVFMLKPEHNVEGAIKALGDRIKDVGLHPAKFEIIFLWVCGEKEGYKKITDTPLIRLFYTDDYVKGLNLAWRKAYGELVVVMDVHADLKEAGYAAMAAVQNAQPPGFGAYMSPSAFAAPKSLERFPDDLFCPKSFIILQALIKGQAIVGPWGKLHKKEVLRASYKLAARDLNTKLKLAVSYLTGVSDVSH